MLFDKCVNSPIYASVLIDPSRIPEWHWNELLLNLSVNPVLKKIRSSRSQALGQRPSRQASVISLHRQNGLSGLRHSREPSVCSSLFGDDRGSLLSPESLQAFCADNDMPYRRVSQNPGGLDGVDEQGSESASCYRRGCSKEESLACSNTGGPSRRLSRRMSGSSCTSTFSSMNKAPVEEAGLCSKDRFEKFLGTRGVGSDSCRQSTQSCGRSTLGGGARDSMFGNMLEVVNAGIARAFSTNSAQDMALQMGNAMADRTKPERKQSWLVTGTHAKIGAQQTVLQLPEEIKEELAACLQHDDTDAEDYLNDIEEEFAEVRQLAFRTGQDLDKRRGAMRALKLERKAAKMKQRLSVESGRPCAFTIEEVAIESPSSKSPRGKQLF